MPLLLFRLFTEENLRQNPNWMWHETVSGGPAARRHQKCPSTPDGLVWSGLVWSGVRSARPSVLPAPLFLSLSLSSSLLPAPRWSPQPSERVRNRLIVSPRWEERGCARGSRGCGCERGVSAGREPGPEEHFGPSELRGGIFFFLQAKIKKVTLHPNDGRLILTIFSSWRNGPIGHVWMELVGLKEKKWCPKRMEGPRESNNSRSKWPSLKFAEIWVWRRVRDALSPFFLCFILLSSWGGAYFSEVSCAARRLELSYCACCCGGFHHPRCYKHRRKESLITSSSLWALWELKKMNWDILEVFFYGIL